MKREIPIEVSRAASEAIVAVRQAEIAHPDVPGPRLIQFGRSGALGARPDVVVAKFDDRGDLHSLKVSKRGKKIHAQANHPLGGNLIVEEHATLRERNLFSPGSTTYVKKVRDLSGKIVDGRHISSVHPEEAHRVVMTAAHKLHESARVVQHRS